jgi:hypothetical protein
MPLNKMLWYAESACAHVDALSIKASNRYENEQGPAFKNGVENLRQVMKGPGIPSDAVERVRTRARLCIERRTGNCHEQASVAFVFLLDRYGASCNGLAMVGTEQFNHVFLVIGIPTARRAGVKAVAARIGRAPDDWQNAIVCDPWYHEWYEMKDFTPKMRQTLIKSSGFGIIRINLDLDFKYLARA